MALAKILRVWFGSAAAACAFALVSGCTLQVSVPPVTDSTDVQLCDSVAAPPKIPCADTVLVSLPPETPLVERIDTLILWDTVRIVEVRPETLVVRDTIVPDIPDSILKWLTAPKCFVSSRRSAPQDMFLVDLSWEKTALFLVSPDTIEEIPMYGTDCAYIDSLKQKIAGR